jgi:hypothetical protein
MGILTEINSPFGECGKMGNLPPPEEEAARGRGNLFGTTQGHKGINGGKAWIKLPAGEPIIGPGKIKLFFFICGWRS